MRKLIAALLYAGSAASAQGTYSTIGDVSCARWFDPTYHVHNRGWLLGYLTGMNAASVSLGKNPDALKGVAGEQVWAWMDNYCKANPLEKASDGAPLLFLDLQDRAMKRQK